jgi:murein tripeptide amidase MpaA
LLRDKYIFKVIPMINPDGVVLGNYRLSYSGNDLNRKWRDTSSRLHPEVYYTKKMLMNLNKTNKIRMLIDMHGHSRNKNVFFYGCKDKYGGNSAQEFPYLMSKIHSAFSFKNCSFAMQKSKEGTQRIAMNYYLKLPYIYTLESSFCGN